MTFASVRNRAWLGALGIACGVVLTGCATTTRTDAGTMAMIDRQMIQDQITRYYYNFGTSNRQSEESFYAEDGVLILGTRKYEGREGIKKAYSRPAPAAPAAGPAPAAGAAPAAAAAPAAPARERTAFNVM